MESAGCKVVTDDQLPSFSPGTVTPLTGGDIIWTDLWTTGAPGGSEAQLFMQFDGNLIIYSGSGHVFMTFPYKGFVDSPFLRMQDDGNLVIYNGSDGSPLWASGTNARS
jgi:hypothetical protein